MIDKVHYELKESDISKGVVVSECCITSCLTYLAG
jgi:hypothetical protein